MKRKNGVTGFLGLGFKPNFSSRDCLLQYVEVVNLNKENLCKVAVSKRSN